MPAGSATTRSHAGADAGRSGLAKAIFALSTLGQRLGIWVGGFPFPLALLSPLAIAWGLLSGSVTYSTIRILFFLPMLVAFAISYFLAPPGASPESFLLFVILYSAWVFVMPMSRRSYDGYYRFVLGIVVLFSILAPIQYFGQFIVKSDLWFTWRSVVPQSMLLEYNSLNEMSWGAGVYKGNGVFLLEPSTLSAMAARALLIAFVILKRFRYAAPLVVGIMFSFSGTGMIFAVLFCLPIFVVELARRYSAVMSLMVGIILVLAAIVMWFVMGDYVMGRLAEFGDPNSSGYARFTSTVKVFDEFLAGTTKEFLVGYGPGTFKRLNAEVTTEQRFASGWIKICFEYGMCGLVSFVLFFVYCVYSSTRSKFITFAMLVQYLVLDGALLVPQLTFFCYALVAMPICVGRETERNSTSVTRQRAAERPPWTGGLRAPEAT